MEGEPKFFIAFDSVEVSDVETGQIVHREDIANKGLRAVTEAVQLADGAVVIPEGGIPWKDALPEVDDSQEP